MKLCLIGGSGHFDYVLNGLACLPDVQLAAFSAGSSGESLAKLQAWLLNDAGLQALPPEAEISYFADFVRAIRAEGRCLVSAEDSFRSTAASLIARDAADGMQIIVF